MLTNTLLKQISSTALSTIVDPLVINFNKHYSSSSINTPLRLAHFLAQSAHETDGFVTLEEYASGSAYEGRRDLGNTQPGDGMRFKGRGIFQVTGRFNYKRYSDILGVNLITTPFLAATPEISVLTALRYWDNKRLSELADKDDIVTITKRINGGRNGLPSRIEYLNKAKNALQIFIEIRIHDRGDRVKTLQSMLAAKGYTVVADGHFGPKTADAVKRFQLTKALPVTGIVDATTYSKLL